MHGYRVIVSLKMCFLQSLKSMHWLGNWCRWRGCRWCVWDGGGAVGRGDCAEYRPL